MNAELYRSETSLDWVLWGLLDWNWRWRRNMLGWHLWRSVAVWKRIAMYKSVTRGAALDLPQTDQISSLEVAGAVLKLPER